MMERLERGIEMQVGRVRGEGGKERGQEREGSREGK